MTKFVKGKSGNPAGRPKGIRDRRLALQALIEPHAEALVHQLVQRALDGDTAALRIAIERLVPSLKAVDLPVPLPNLSGPLSQQGAKVLGAMSRGEIGTSDAKQVIDALSAQARLLEISELERRIIELEGRYAQTEK